MANSQPASNPKTPGNSPDPPAEKLGVLFVHGMGEQQRGDTLLGFGEPVVKFLRRWVDGQTSTDPFKSAVGLRNVEAIRVNGRDPNRPSNTTISLNDRKRQQWLMAESWWADDFKPANFTEVLNWGIRVVPFVLSDTVRYQWSRRKHLTNEGQLLLTIVSGPFLQALLLLMLPIAAIPFLRSIIANLMVRLSRSVGDPYLLLSSPIRLASMVERVHHDIRWLQDQQCTGVAVVAHSQGAAVAHHALRSFAGGDYDVITNPQRAVPITRFITFGAAIEKLHFLQQIDIRGKNLLRGGMLQSAIALALLFSVLFGWQYPKWLSNITWLSERGWWDTWWNKGNWWTLGLWLLLTALFWLGPRIFQKPMRTEIIKYSEPGEGDLWDRGNLKADPNTEAPKAKWTDLYARADPVSLGPILELTRDSPCDPSTPQSPLENPDETSWEIRNQDSVLFDHTTYFENISQFMVPLIGGLCVDSRWTDVLDFRQPFFAAASRQRSRRVEWLVRAFYVVAATLALVSTTLGLMNRLDDVGRPVRRGIEFLADEIALPLEGIVRANTGSGEVAESTLGVITLLVIATLFYMVLIKGAWQAWDAGKADRFLDQRQALARAIEDGQPCDQAQLLGPFRAGSGRFVALTALVPIAAAVSIAWMLIA